MIGHWLTAGWRSLVANPLFSLITIASLSVGCCGALLAFANIRQHLSFERWIPHADRIVLERHTLGMGGNFGEEARLFKIPRDEIRPSLRDAIEGRIDGMIAQTRILACNFVKWPDAPPPTAGQGPAPPPPFQSRCVDRDFFRVFELEFVEGNAVSALATPDTIIVSERVALKYFGEGPALGKTFESTLPDIVLRVGGVIRNAPAATHLELDALLSMDLRLRRTGPGGSTPPLDYNNLNVSMRGQHFIRMAEDADARRFVASARSRIQGLFDENLRARQRPAGYEEEFEAEQVSIVPLLDIHLAGEERTGMQSSGDVSMLTTLGTGAIALLGISAFNYVALSLARSLRRRREVGLRKVLGASHGDLVRQYLSESMLVTAVSLAIGFAMAAFLHPWFARTIGQPETLFVMHDPAFLTAAFVTAVLLALAVGFYPAFYLANARPRAGLEGSETAPPTGMSRFVSGGLLGLQIAVATVLLTVALTMAAQADYVARRPLGFDFRGMHVSMS